MDFAFKYAEKTALESESDYPYTAQDGTCHADIDEETVKVVDYRDVAPHEPKQLMAALN